MALPAHVVSLLTLSTVTVTVDSMNSTTTVTDWHSMQTRAELALKKALDRRDAADYGVQQAERALEAIKIRRRRAEDIALAAGQGVR